MSAGENPLGQTSTQELTSSKWRVDGSGSGNLAEVFGDLQELHSPPQDMLEDVLNMQEEDRAQAEAISNNQAVMNAVHNDSGENTGYDQTQAIVVAQVVFIEEDGSEIGNIPQVPENQHGIVTVPTTMQTGPGPEQQGQVESQAWPTAGQEVEAGNEEVQRETEVAVLSVASGQADDAVGQPVEEEAPQIFTLERHPDHQGKRTVEYQPAKKVRSGLLIDDVFDIKGLFR